MITGASRGIGRAIAIRFAAAGMSVALLARDADGLAETLESARESGGRGEAYVADVADERSVTAAHERCVADLGPVEVLINNAGLPGPTGPMWEVDSREWWATQEVNLRGTVNCARAVLPGMVERRR